MDSKFWRSDMSGMLLVMWKDKKAKKLVIIVSTHGMEVVKGKRKTVEKPLVINAYNISMNGCNRLDQYVSYYSNLSRKTVKWWKRLFFWIIEVSQVNSYILHSLSHCDSTISLKRFKQTLITELVDFAYMIMPDDQPQQRVGRPQISVTYERYQDKRHLVAYVEADRNCIVCSTSSKRKRTCFVCSGCADRPHLDPKGCFEAYHTQ